MKTITLIILILISNIAYAETPWIGRGVPDKTNIAIRAFGEKLVFPWACELAVHSSLSRNEIEIHCDIENKDNKSIDSLLVLFALPDKCALSEFEVQNSELVEQKIEHQNSIVNGKWIYEFELKLKKDRSTFTRVIKNESLCFSAMSSNRGLVKSVTDKIWNKKN